MDNHIQTSKSNTSNNNTKNTVFKEENKERNLNSFYDSLGNFKMKEYECYYNKQSVQEINIKGLNAPIVLKQMLKLKNVITI